MSDNLFWLTEAQFERLRPYSPDEVPGGGEGRRPKGDLRHRARFEVRLPLGGRAT